MLAEALREALKNLSPGARIFIAYSGGVDSQVLLHVASRWALQKGVQLTALHLNHGLSPNAEEWQKFCEQQCEALGLVLLNKMVDLGGASASGLEQRAREARYTWFETLLEAEDILLMAHHREDQAETLLLRALRGSGTRGLSAIPAARALGKGDIVRPFLNRSKADIYAYARKYDLTWIEDESNLSLKFDRNYVRHQLIPRLIERWPQATRQLTRSAKNCRDDLSLLDDLAAVDTNSCQIEQKPLLLEVLPPLDLSVFKALSPARQRNVLQYLLRPLLAYPVPSEQMNEWLRQVNDAESGSQGELNLKEVSLVLHDGQVHFKGPPVSNMAEVSLEWLTNSPLVIAQCGCEIRLILKSEVPSTEVKTLAFEPGEAVCVHWRQGGERVQLQGETFSRSLKKLFQEKRVAPWLRGTMPLISVDGYIVWSALLGDFSPCLIDSKGQYYTFELNSEGQIKSNC